VSGITAVGADPMSRPPVRCPKCAFDGFLYSRPTWHEEQPATTHDHGTFREHLDWFCQICDYRIETPTADST
jgi:hypothetical protein